MADEMIRDLALLIEYADDHASARGAYDATCGTCVRVRRQAEEIAKVVWNEGYRTPPGGGDRG